MAKSIQDAAVDLAAAIKDSDELSDPVFPKVADLLTRFAKEHGDVAKKAATARKAGLDLNDEIDEAVEAAAKAKSKRLGDLKKVYDAHMGFLTCLHALASGMDKARKFEPAGTDIQKVIDKLEFSDKKLVDKLRKAAKAYYTTESGLQKAVESWSVRASQVTKALKLAQGKLNAADPVSKVHAKFMDDLRGRLESLVKTLGV